MMTEPAEDFFTTFQRLMNPAGLPGLNALFPAHPAEIDKKIAELTAVRAWLAASIGTLDLTLKALQFQRTLLAPTAEKGASSAVEPPLPNPALWAWEVMQKAAATGAKPQAAKQGRKRRAG
jgi:hypothetical protein